MCTILFFVLRQCEQNYCAHLCIQSIQNMQHCKSRLSITVFLSKVALPVSAVSVWALAIQDIVHTYKFWTSCPLNCSDTELCQSPWEHAREITLYNSLGLQSKHTPWSALLVAGFSNDTDIKIFIIGLNTCKFTFRVIYKCFALQKIQRHKKNTHRHRKKKSMAIKVCNWAKRISSLT